MAEANNLLEFCHEAPDEFMENYLFLTKQLSPPNTLAGLSKEIWDKFEINKQSTSQFLFKIDLWKSLNKHVKMYNYGLFMAGSTLNGFGLKSSDVDLSLLTKTPSNNEKDQAVSNLTILMEILKKNDRYKNFQLIKASMPLIKFTESLDNLSIDINFNATANIKNTHLLYCYSQVDWRMKPLVIIIKLWAKSHKIINAKYGSLSSYPLILMVIHFLQCGVKPVLLPNLQDLYKDKFKKTNTIKSIKFFDKTISSSSNLHPRNGQPLSELLIEFFKYYSDFQFDKYVISVRKGTKLLRIQYILDLSETSNLLNSYVLNYMYIEEPFNLSNAGRTVHKFDTFKRIQTVFKTSYSKLEKSNKLDSIFVSIDS